MQYTFLEDIENLKRNYESFRDELLKYDIIDEAGMATTGSQFSDVGKQYMNPEQNQSNDIAFSPMSSSVQRNKSFEVLNPDHPNPLSDVESETYDSDDYQNQGGSRDVQRSVRKAQRTSGNSDSWLTEGGEGFTGENIMNAAGLGLQIANAYGNTASSEAESWSQTGNFALQGASTGFAIGGPLGAAIGGIAGLTAGVFDMLGDIHKRNTDKRHKVNAKNEELKTKRQLQHAVDTQSADLKKLQALRKSQLNYLDINI